MQPLRRSTKPVACLAALGLAGCGQNAIQTPYPSKSLAELTKPVPVYSKAPCWMQKEWSADNSRKKTAQTGKVVVYAPPCVTDKKQDKKPATDEQPKTS